MAREEGNFVDMMAGVLMMVCLFAIILTMLAYSALIERRLAVNNAVRNYLYIAEQQGGLQTTDVEALRKFLEVNYGCTDINITVNEGVNWIDQGSFQVPYGSEIRLSVTMKMPNPIYQVLGLSEEQKANGGSDTYWFLVKIRDKIDYRVGFTSTSRW